MTDADTIKALIGILIVMVGGFYANFLWEMRKLRKNVHAIRNILTHHEFRLVNLERKIGIPEYTYPPDNP